MISDFVKTRVWETGWLKNRACPTLINYKLGNIEVCGMQFLNELITSPFS